jgi:hypothetical protein
MLLTINAQNLETPLLHLVASSPPVATLNPFGFSDLPRKYGAEVAKILLISGSAVDAKNKVQVQDYFPSALAAVYMLQLTTGKSYHMQTRETPLHLAARRGFLDVMEHLLKNGADVNAENQVLDL